MKYTLYKNHKFIDINTNRWAPGLLSSHSTVQLDMVNNLLCWNFQFCKHIHIIQ